MNIFDYIENHHFKFKKKIRLIELFAGIETQAMALKKICQLKGHPFEMYKISEWDVNSLKSYHAIHYEEDTTDYSADLDEFQIEDRLMRFGISTDGKTPLSIEQLKNKSTKWKKDVYNDIIATHNIGSITNVHASDLQIDDVNEYEYIVTYSFPCQDLSMAGNQKGMKRGSGTRSGLLWEFQRLLDECSTLPQILLMENVPNVHGKKNINDFNSWCAFLEQKGYSNFWKDMNAKNYGIPQNRNRTIMISILGNYSYEFEKGFESPLRLSDLLEKNVDDKYDISERTLEALQTYHGNFPRKEVFERSLKMCNEKDISTTLTTKSARPNGPFIKKIDDKLSIRKLTPRECGRLMGVSDDDIKKMMKIHSDSQLYKQFGNAIVTNVLFYALLPLF